MSCEHLICAGCARPVVEGRCPVCREMRAEKHGGIPPLLVAFLLLVAVSLLAVVSAVAVTPG